MRHRASDVNPAFDTASYGRLFDDAGYGGGFDLTADSAFPGGFVPYATPAPPAPSRARPLAVAGTAATALVGVALLITGATQATQANEVSGIPLPQPGPNTIAAHQAAAPAVRHPQATSSPTPGPTTTTPAPPAQNAVRPAQGAQLPNTIRLPKGGTAYLVHGQVSADGSLPIPSGVNQAAWWGTGLSAAAGATVFAGHVNWAGKTGPFAELWQDKPGDIVTLRDNSGVEWRYQVTQVLTLNKDQLPPQAPTLFASTGPARIVLATCGGEWLSGTQTYADNRVMVATPIGH
ncbi:MAG TPA: class F sortase [Pseudonocardiaceae bacterium]|nr:class F sortase [Pseudonocardiaceae bacterium]